MKKSCTVILAALVVLSGCSTPPNPPQGSGIGLEATTIAYGKVLNVKEYSKTNESKSTYTASKTESHKSPLGKNYALGRPVPADDGYDEFINEPVPAINMVELHIKNEQGPTFKIDQVKNGSYYMGQRVRITMTGNEAKVTPY